MQKATVNVSWLLDAIRSFQADAQVHLFENKPLQRVELLEIKFTDAKTYSLNQLSQSYAPAQVFRLIPCTDASQTVMTIKELRHALEQHHVKDALVAFQRQVSSQGISMVNDLLLSGVNATVHSAKECNYFAPSSSFAGVNLGLTFHEHLGQATLLYSDTYLNPFRQLNAQWFEDLLNNTDSVLHTLRVAHTQCGGTFQSNLFAIPLVEKQAPPVESFSENSSAGPVGAIGPVGVRGPVGPPGCSGNDIQFVKQVPKWRVLDAQQMANAFPCLAALPDCSRIFETVGQNGYTISVCKKSWPQLTQNFGSAAQRLASLLN